VGSKFPRDRPTVNPLRDDIRDLLQIGTDKGTDDREIVAALMILSTYSGSKPNREEVARVIQKLVSIPTQNLGK
jgi:hypothetical protein